MTLLIAIVLGAMAVIMTTAWACQLLADNSGWTDVFWTCGTGATCALTALVPFGGNEEPTWRQMLVAALVAIWALRLGSYVALRVAGGAEDVRYVALKREWGENFQRRMLGLSMVQAPATALLSVSILLAARRPDPALRPTDLAGVAILAVAILGEALADRQMKAFKAAPANKDRVCDTGLWGWSRHPNYLFEFLGWVAYPVIAVDPAHPWTWASLIAPIVMFAILRFGTGVPPLEAAMIVSKGDAYRRYQARVSAFLPRPPKDAAA